MKKEELIQKAYEIAVERYAAVGVDTEQVLKTMQDFHLSLHCWQADDVAGFEVQAGSLTGGIQATGNYPGKARNIDELRADILKAASYIPGTHRLNLHEIYGDFQGKVVDRDQVEPEHFKSWIEWGKEHNMKLEDTCNRDAATIWLDKQEKDLSKRYKMFNVERRPTDRRWQFILKYSSDGIHWGEGVAQSGDLYDRSSAFYNPFRDVWALSMRYGTTVSSRSRSYLENKDPEMAVSFAHRIRKGVPDKNMVYWFTPSDKEPRHPEFPEVDYLNLICFHFIFKYLPTGMKEKHHLLGSTIHQKNWKKIYMVTVYSCTKDGNQWILRKFIPCWTKDYLLKK